MEINKKEDLRTEQLLRKVEKMRKELRLLEAEVSKACVDWGKRRGMSAYREWYVRNDLKRIKGDV